MSALTHNESSSNKDHGARCRTNTNRQRPMKVLALGFPRTGTKSLNAALSQLGLKPYDYEDRLDLGHFPVWTEALHRKYHGQGSGLGRELFDSLMDGFDAVLDAPCCLFIDELTTAYPEAKVILTTRDVAKWHNSMTATIFRHSSWPSWTILRYTDRLAADVCNFVDTMWACLCDGDTGEGAKQAFIDHNNYVRKVVPPERLLEFHPADGWGPLCRFLDVPEPGTPFPMANNSAGFQDSGGGLWMGCVKRSIVKVGIGVLGMGAVAWGASWVWEWTIIMNWSQ